MQKTYPKKGCTNDEKSMKNGPQNGPKIIKNPSKNGYKKNLKINEKRNSPKTMFLYRLGGKGDAKQPEKKQKKETKQLHAI